MSYIITDDKHYKNIAKSLRNKMQTDRQYYPSEMAIAIDNIPSSADRTDDPVAGIYYTNPNENGLPTKVKIIGINSPNANVPDIFKYDFCRPSIKQIDFINCVFKSLLISSFERLILLTKINLPDGLSSVANNAFFGCVNLADINIPDSVKAIGQWAFYDCKSLKKINLPDGIETIGLEVFVNCISMHTINLPSSLVLVSSRAFISCSKLMYVTLGDKFHCNNLNLASSILYTRETIVSWLIALSDRTGQDAYTLIIGNTNLKKLTEEDKMIAFNKNWTLK